MDRGLLFYFWGCGDNQIIEFALMRARLNKHEKDVVLRVLDECMPQEKIAEELGYSVRRTQEFWYSGADKLLSIPWVKAYALSLKDV